ncbi:2Fe-2S iron-sulfur cluster-binding protein [Ruegeria sp. 2012CJ41-6]|uniref:2Fe-2S iron-sulfur cluster-binding protein n=1 Tax=Ruegeria spongiae TaxID=2942209 RepID=A0ABT0Q8E7_9RHOB|nr:2Fe-2S iron-sulfur cluster-binding protein [Ruegeria spongiae]MCL6286072.1 2Fe-2S iron-sulfur cluster-binding protein [Ruegeria spongiae]
MTETICINVNGEEFTATVPPRTQLAEVLRDHLHLTGTHLGCEQGVCGACTVMMDGRPVRSCITFAGHCDGATIQTIEGGDDPLGQMLTEAFSRHHALQCGFCTPGMLATSRDILTRFSNPDEALVRHELSGNICRCTGYQGIVAAIMDVGSQIDTCDQTRTDDIRRAAFTPFEPEENLNAAPDPATAGSVVQDKDWTVITRSFGLNHPVGDVWDLFSDVSRVASCVPGASVAEVTEETFSGAIEVSFGPIKARFGGKGTYANNLQSRKGHLSGSGADKNGQSNVRGELHYDIVKKTEDTSTVDVEFRFNVQGVLAQFNRPELVTGFVDFLLQRFVANCNSVLSGGTATSEHKIGAFSLAVAVIKSWFKRRKT